jgi:branched-chain amino acid transport system permease protein
MFLQLIVAGLGLGSVYAMIALGFAMYLRSIRLLNFSHGEMTMAGALIGVGVYVYLGIPFVLGFLTVAILTGIFGVFIERMVFRPIWTTEQHDPFLTRTIFATLAVGMLLTNLALLIGGPHPIRVPPPLGYEAIFVFGTRIVPQHLLTLATAIPLVGVLQIFLQRSRVGLAMRAVMLDRETASLMGVNVRRSISWTFAISSALAGIAGFMIAPVIFWSFEMGFIGIKAFAGLTIGGLYSFPGAVVGGLTIGLLEAFIGAYLSSSYRDVVVFGILIFMLLVKPKGLFGAAGGKG